MRTPTGLSVGILSVALTGCGTQQSQPIYTPPQTILPNTVPELSRITTISSEEMGMYGGIMTRHVREKTANGVRERLLGICHFSKVHIPSTPEIRNSFEARTGKKMESNWMR